MFDFCALLAVDDDSALSSLSYLGAKAYKSERTSQSVQVSAYKSEQTFSRGFSCTVSQLYSPFNIEGARRRGVGRRVAVRREGA